jgi:hypothetical protein
LPKADFVTSALSGIAWQPILLHDEKGRKRLPAYRLHYFPESGNSFKIALMLTLCGQTFEPIWTDFGGGVTRTAEWRSAVNEMGEIPVLEEDGDRLSQTAPLLLRLAERYERFGGQNEREQFEILRWLFWDNHKLTGYMAPYRFQRAFTPSPDPNALKFLKNRLDQFLDILAVDGAPGVIGLLKECHSARSDQGARKRAPQAVSSLDRSCAP